MASRTTGIAGAQTHARSASHAIAVALVGAAYCGAASQARAQDAPDATTIETLIVTATKREVNVQEIPFSINAVGGETLERANVQNVSELSRIAPELRANESVVKNNIAIRGAIDSSDAAGSDHGIGVVIDDVPAAGIADASLGQGFFDLDRVEILRGPQGTLFGRNVTGGVISIHSRLPSFEPEARVQVGYGRHESYQGQIFVTGPLSDSVAGKLSLAARGRGNTRRNIVIGGGQGHYDVVSGRGQLLWRPTDRFRVRLGLEATHIEGNDDLPGAYFGNTEPRTLQPMLTPIIAGPWGPAGVYPDLNYTDPNILNTGTNGKVRVNSGGGLVRVDWDLGEIGEVTSISGVRSIHTFQFGHYDGTPFGVLASSLDVDEKQFTEELRIASPDDRRLRYVFGLFLLESTRKYLSKTDMDCSAFPPVSLTGSPAICFTATRGAQFAGQVGRTAFPGLYQRQSVDLASKAVFGELAFDLVPRLTATVGGRMTWDKRSGDTQKTLLNGVLFRNSGAPAGTILGFTAQGVPIVATTTALSGLAPGGSVAGTLNGVEIGGGYEEDWESFTPKATLDYKPREGLLFYATVARGYLAGGFDQRGSNGAGLLTPFDPQYVWNYEAGFKGTFFDRRLLTNLSVYQMRFKDLQVRLFDSACVCSTVKNAGRAKSEGFELNLVANPLDWLTLGAAWAHTRARYTEYVVPNPPPAPPTVFSGNRIIGTPRDSVSLYADTAWDLGERGRLRFGANVQFASKVFFSEANNDPAFVHARSDRPGIVDLQLAWTSADDRWEASLWGKNVTDRRFLIGWSSSNPFIFAAAPAVPAGSGVGTGMPTTWNQRASYGVTLTRSFR